MGVQLNPWTLTRQAIGCLTQALSLCGFQVREQEDFLEGARLLLKRYADVKVLKKKLKQKERKLCAVSPRWAFLRIHSEDRYKTGS